MIDFDPEELAAELDPAERALLSELAGGLLVARPRPGAGFRGRLRRKILATGGALPRRPPRLRRRVAAFLVAGAVLVLVGASGLTGGGPLAPPAGGPQVAQAR